MAFVAQTSYHRVWKRVLDLLVAAPIVLFLMPTLLFAWFARQLFESPLQPVIFIGRSAHPYRGLTAKSPWLRHSMRMWDVMLGRASLVGPRIAALSELDGKAIQLRAVVSPGLTCLHRLRVRSNVAFGPEYLSDREYAEQCSFATDVSILLRSALVSIYGAPTAASAPVVEILGVEIDNFAMDDALGTIEAALEDGSSGARLAFVNADCLNRAAGNREYREALESMSLVLPDGIGLKIAGSVLGRPIRQNVNGTDMFPLLCAQMNEMGSRLFLLGARREVVEALADRVRSQYPRVIVCGAQDGYFEDEDAVVRRIAAAEPDVLLVALGAPRQDVFIARHRHRLGAKVCIGVGGLFDFFSGRIPRAPQWLRDAGLEWTYRLYQEPGRMWKRYMIGNFIFLARVFAEKVGVAHYADTTAVIR